MKNQSHCCLNNISYLLRTTHNQSAFPLHHSRPIINLLSSSSSRQDESLLHFAVGFTVTGSIGALLNMIVLYLYCKRREAQENKHNLLIINQCATGKPTIIICQHNRVNANCGLILRLVSRIEPQVMI